MCQVLCLISSSVINLFVVTMLQGVGGEGENPLGTQYEDPSQSKKYKPVLSGDGFILPRAKPTVEVCACVCKFPVAPMYM